MVSWEPLIRFCLLRTLFLFYRSHWVLQALLSVAALSLLAYKPLAFAWPGMFWLKITGYGLSALIDYLLKRTFYFYQNLGWSVKGLFASIWLLDALLFAVLLLFLQLIFA